MKGKASTGVWAAGVVLSLGIAAWSYRYLLPHAPGVPPQIARNLMYRPWLIVHAGLAATALVLGPWQFLPRLRASIPRLHRWMGRIYIFACLLGGSAGLLVAWGTSAGPIAQLGFGTLAVLWVVCAAQAWRMALARRFVEHRRWMVRSFAMTFAAVTLRLYLPIPPILGYDFMDGYRIISWVAWVPNLIAAELYLNWARVRKAALASA